MKDEKLDLEQIKNEVNELKKLRSSNKKDIFEKATKLSVAQIKKVQHPISPLNIDRKNELIYFLIHEDDNQNVRQTKFEVNKAKITITDLYNYFQENYNEDLEDAKRDGYNLYRSLCIKRTISIEKMQEWANIIGKPYSGFIFSDKKIEPPENFDKETLNIECSDIEYDIGIVHIHASELEEFSFNKEDLIERIGSNGKAILKNRLDLKSKLEE